MHRLETIAPDIAALLKQCDELCLRNIAIEVAHMAVESAGLQEPAVEAGWDALSEERYGDQAERTSIQELADQLDETAWEVQDQVDQGMSSTDDYVAAFKRARAVSAVWFALDRDASTAAREAVYEANAAIGDLSAMRDKVLQRVENDG